MNKSIKSITMALALVSLLVGCNKDDAEPEDENELITTVRLKFTETGATTSQTFEWKDLDGDGGKAPTVQSISLKANKTYKMDVTFLDESKTPAEDITQEVKKEADEHLVVITATPTSLFGYTADDKDSRNLPIGLTGTLKTSGINTGALRLQLRHQPPVSGKAVKDGTVGPGSDDVNITFNFATIL